MNLSDEHFANHIFFIAQDAAGIDFQLNPVVRFFLQFGIQVIEYFSPGASVRCQSGQFDDRRLRNCITTRGH